MVSRILRERIFSNSIAYNLSKYVEQHLVETRKIILFLNKIINGHRNKGHFK